MAEEKRKHDLRDGLPPTSIDTVQEHSVLDAERRRAPDTGDEVGSDRGVPEGQNTKQGA